MKLLKYMNERGGIAAPLVTKEDFWKDGGDDIFDNCTPFINELKKAGELLLRGTKKRLLKDINLVETRTDRHPLSSSVQFHDYCDLNLGKKFGWYPRSGGVFTKTGYIPDAYGTSYIIFIPGELKYIWSPMVYDLFSLNSFFKISKKIVDESQLILMNYSVSIAFPKHLIGKTVGDVLDFALDSYIDNDLGGAVKSAHEIMFKCNNYYMVKNKHRDRLYKRIFLGGGVS